MRIYLSFFYTIVLTFSIIILTSCSNDFNQGEIQKVGMLVEHSINDQTWGNKGYNGLLDIKEEFDVDVLFKEEVTTQQEVNRAVEEFANKGVNLIFGHSSIYGKMFDTIRVAYPEIHFIYFNGGYYGDNLTSLNFSSRAMGFFGGMVAGEMTKTNEVGIIAAYEWQPEIEGFYEGVSYQNPDANVHMNFVNSWDDTERALKLYDRMNEQGIDVLYPAGDAFSIPLINQVKKENKYAIGFITDQASLGNNTVLTSTVQHVDNLYLLAAKKFNDDELKGGVFVFDFEDEVISMGKFSPLVPKSIKDEIDDAVEEYIERGLLPNEW